MQIQTCDSVEQAGWLDLRLALWPEGGAEAHLPEMRALLAAPERYGQYVAYDDAATPSGLLELALRHDYVNGTESSPVAFIEGIYVVPEARQRGVARQLMECAFAWARERGCREIASDALLDNTTSHAVHLALGFVETERVVYFVRRLGIG